MAFGQTAWGSSQTRSTCSLTAARCCSVLWHPSLRAEIPMRNTATGMQRPYTLAPLRWHAHYHPDHACLRREWCTVCNRRCLVPNFTPLPCLIPTHTAANPMRPCSPLTPLPSPLPGPHSHRCHRPCLVPTHTAGRPDSDSHHAAICERRCWAAS